MKLPLLKTGQRFNPSSKGGGIYPMADEGLMPQTRYYNVYVRGHNGENYCHQIFNYATYNRIRIIRSCDPFVRPGCSKRVASDGNLGVNQVRAIFNNAANSIAANYPDAEVEVNTGRAC